jgi:hypothetical protein
VVTFRFYVVSTVAFFLALAVGVLVGSVLDGRIADGLQDRLERVETSLDETVAAIDQKNVEIDQLERYIEASAPYAVEGRLEATSTVVVAEPGLDAAPVEDLVRRLREAGSRVEGIVWLESRWELSDEQDLAAAAELAGVDSDDPAEVRAALWELVLAPEEAESGPNSTTTTTGEVPPGDQPAGAGPATTGPTTTGPTTTGPATTGPATTAPTTTAADVAAAPVFDRAPLSELAQAGLVRLQRTDGETESPGGELLLVAATGAASSLADPGAATTELVRRAAAAGVSSVLAEVAVLPEDGSEPERGRLVTEALETGPATFSTVDDLELIAGRVAVVLALAELRDGNVGRYGFGPDVDGVLPPWPGP